MGIRGAIIPIALLLNTLSNWWTLGGIACGLRPDGGELHCWWTRTPLGELEPPAGEFKEVSVGIEHACAIRAGGELECWGIDPENAKVSPPAGEFLSVDAGWDGDVHEPGGDALNDGGFSCGLRADAVVECWGEQKFLRRRFR